MSSSFRKAGAPALLLAMAAAPAAWAQQKYFVPSVELSAEHYTNRELRANSADEDPTTAYKGVLEARMGRATPRSDVELRPRLIVQEFPDRDGVDPLEAFLDLNAQYRTRKSVFALAASFRHQDTINADYGEARFDDGTDPTTPPEDLDTGVVFVGSTRKSYRIEPSFRTPLSERTALEGMLQLEAVRYDSDIDNTRVGYDSPYVELVVTHALTPRTEFGIGPYFSRYEPQTDTRRTDSMGARIGLRRQWTERSKLEAVLRVERNEQTQFGPPQVQQDTTEWGIELLGERRNEVGGLRYSIGRFLRPSGLGNRRENDQIRLQYDRPLSERTVLRTALRLQRDRRIGNDSADQQRDRARGELSLAYRITPTWTVTGGYRYAWQDLGPGIDQADGHTGFLSLRFRGLDPRRQNR